MRALPSAVAAADPALVRPRDVGHIYANPAKELRDLEHQGSLLRVAHGYYAVVPEIARGRRWSPAVEAVGVAIGQVDYGTDGAAAMGPSAARLLGRLPRALGTATIAVPKSRPAVETVAGVVQFVMRDVAGLDVQRTETELGQAWVTTAEQTLLDIADRPLLGGITFDEAIAMLEALAADSDLEFAIDLGRRQHKRSARSAIAAVMEGADWGKVLAP